MHHISELISKLSEILPSKKTPPPLIGVIGHDVLQSRISYSWHKQFFSIYARTLFNKFEHNSRAWTKKYREIGIFFKGRSSLSNLVSLVPGYFIEGSPDGFVESHAQDEGSDLEL